MKKFLRWLKAEHLAELLIAIFAFRLLLFGVGLFVQNKVGEVDGNWKVHAQHIDGGVRGQLEQVWETWDSPWYIQIAGSGYHDGGLPFTSRERADVAFFPGYPMLMHALSAVTKLSLGMSGILISWASTIGIVVFGYKLLLVRKVSKKTARLTLLLLFAHPIGFIFGAVYTEALFLFLVLGALYFWETNQLALFWVLGFWAGLTRPVGILLAAPPAIQMLQQHFWKQPIKQWMAQGFSASGPLLGLAAYCVYLHHKTGYWDAFNRVEATYFARHTSLLHVFHSLFIQPFAGPNWAYFAVFAWVTLLFLVIYRKKIGYDYLAWSLLMMFGPLATQILGMPRYTTVIFPLSLAGAYFLKDKSTAVRRVVIGLTLSAQIVLFILWVMSAEILQ